MASSPEDSIWKHCTFLDVFIDEDTLSVHEELLQNSTYFLDIMNKSKPAEFNNIISLL